MKTIMVFFIFSLLHSSPLFLPVAKYQFDQDARGSYSSAPGVETTCDFPKNPGKSFAVFVAGRRAEVVIGVKYEGNQNLKVLDVYASVHSRFDPRMVVDIFTTRAPDNVSVPANGQASFAYGFTVSYFSKAGEYDLVGTIVYEINQTRYQNTFYNGTIQVTEDLADSAALIFLGFMVPAYVILVVGMCLEKRAKRAREVEVQTGKVDTSAEKPGSSKSKKKKKKKMKDN